MPSNDVKIQYTKCNNKNQNDSSMTDVLDNAHCVLLGPNYTVKMTVLPRVAYILLNPMHYAVKKLYFSTHRL